MENKDWMSSIGYIRFLPRFRKDGSLIDNPTREEHLLEIAEEKKRVKFEEEYLESLTNNNGE
jgi:hypothetical protein